MTQDSWQQFNHPHVRALAWALFSTPLVFDMDGQLPSSRTSDLDFLHRLDAQPEPLSQHLANCNSHRLGYYFEALWAYYFQSHPDYQLLIHNIQIINDERRTLGAFDFIYKYLPTGNNHHLEVSVKFYLFIGDKPEQMEDQQLWPGPNPKDNLATKVTRLLNHQLPLSSTVEGISAIEALAENAPVSAAAALKGYLFYPLDMMPTNIDWAPHNHHCGHWLFVSQLGELTAQHPSSRWALLSKREWLGENLGIPAEATHTTDTFIPLLEEKLSHFPLMVARVESADRSFNELERFFVVPNGWPLNTY